MGDSEASTPRIGGVSDPHRHLEVRASFNPSAHLRYGTASLMEGYVLKAGQTFHIRKRRFLRLHGATLSSYKESGAQPSWERSVLDCKVYAGSPGSRQLIVEMQDRKLELWAETEEERDQWVAAFEHAGSQSLEKYYELGKQIGAGAFGKVKLARSKEEDDNAIYVCKIIEKGDPAKRMRHRKYLERETAIMRSVRHQNIVRIYDIFETDENVSMVMEYCEGGDLFDGISSSNHLTEKEASDIFYQLFNALEYLHRKGIVHRDIKPANFLSATKEPPFVAKLTDFGLSNIVDDEYSDVLKTHVGTPYFLSPECLKGELYGPKVDCWAMGVSLYYLLSGKFPFTGSTKDNAFRAMMYSPVEFPNEYWKDVTEEAKEFIRGLLMKDPDLRLSATDALEHHWITHVGPTTIRNLNTHLSKLSMDKRSSTLALGVLD